MFQLLESSKQHLPLKEYLKNTGDYYVIPIILFALLIAIILTISIPALKKSINPQIILAIKLFQVMMYMIMFFGLLMSTPVILDYYMNHKNTYYNVTYEAKDVEVKKVEMKVHPSIFTSYSDYEIDIRKIGTEEVTSFAMPRNPKIYQNDSGTIIIKGRTNDKPKTTSDLNDVYRIELELK